MAKETLTAKVSPKNLERLEEYAEREGISKSEATDRLVKQGLDVEESDMRLVPVQTDGGTIIEDRLDEIHRQQSQKFNEIGDKIDEQPEYTVIQNIELLLAVLFGFSGAVIGVIGMLSYANLGIAP
jgi:parvulin-like peptidyl-prolyl isomerase